MNGMNNGNNEFNNQNNMNYQNQQMYNYQNMNNYQELNNQPLNNNQNAGFSKNNNNNTLVIILLLLVIGLSGFIVYDKVIKEDSNNNIDNNVTNPNESDENNKINELVKFDRNQITIRENVIENGKEYYEILTIKNSDLVVDIKLYTKKGKNQYDYGYDDEIIMDLYVNGTKKDENSLRKYIRCTLDDCSDEFDVYSFEDEKKSVNDWINGAIGTIKGDKNYLYLHILRDDSSFYIINEKGEILDSSGIKFYGDYKYQGDMELSTACKTFNYGEIYDYNENPESIRNGTGFIQENAIYYLKLSKFFERDGQGISTANEYKATISNDKINIEKIGNCEVEPIGEKTDDGDYEDM